MKNQTDGTYSNTLPYPEKDKSQGFSGTLTDGDELIMFDVSNGGTDNSLVVSTGTDWMVTSVTTFWEGDTATYLDFDGVKLDKQLLKEIIEHVKANQKPTIIYQEVGMWTFTNIIIVALICLVTVKVVIPNLTIRKMARFFAKCIYWPFKRSKETVETEIKSAISNVAEDHQREEE